MARNMATLRVARGHGSRGYTPRRSRGTCGRGRRVSSPGIRTDTGRDYFGGPARRCTRALETIFTKRSGMRRLRRQTTRPSRIGRQ